MLITGAATSDPYGSDGVPLITFCSRAKKNRWKDRGATPRRRHRLRSQHPPLRPPRHCARCTLRLRHLPRLRAQQHPAIIAADSMQQAPAQTHSASTRRPRRMVLRRRRISDGADGRRRLVGRMAQMPAVAPPHPAEQQRRLRRLQQASRTLLLLLHHAPASMRSMSSEARATATCIGKRRKSFFRC